MLKGIDVSSYQSTFDTDGISFVIIKATEGRSYVNPRLTAQVKRARDGGCVVGFYHFLWPGNIKAQAEYFVSKAPEKAGDLLAVDWEWTGEHTRASNAEKDRFIKEVKRLRPNHQVMLYTNRDFWLNHDTTSYAGDALWIADYVTAGKPRIKAKWRIHQYTSTPLDKNVADFASEEALRDWAKP
ncbi:glycoside hydrolase family 25 protein [Streptomyces sp. NPDC046925]|uniref:glycoside hydrolase family 25 protein n=1 Tax=Streptomyces sp. NPDC046925 TaxID=3155375 RepID=UPI0033C3683C